MKKSIILLSFIASFSASSQNIHEMFSDEEKYNMCGGRYGPSSSPVFGDVSRSGDDIQMASLSAKVNQLQTVSYQDKSAVSAIYMKAKSDRDFTRKSKGQYDQLGAHYSKRGNVGQQVYSSTSAGLNNAYKIISEHANDNVYDILKSKQNIKIFNKFRRVGYTNLDVLNVCQYYWK